MFRGKALSRPGTLTVSPIRPYFDIGVEILDRYHLLLSCQYSVCRIS